MPGRVVQPHEIDVSNADDVLHDEGQNDFGGAGAGANINDVAEVTVEDDHTILAIHATMNVATRDDVETSAETASLQATNVQVSTRDGFSSADRAGILYDGRVLPVASVTFENTTDGTAAAAGAAPSELEVWLDPRKMHDDAPQVLNGGQSISIHGEAVDDPSDVAVLSADLEAYLRSDGRGLS